MIKITDNLFDLTGKLNTNDATCGSLIRVAWHIKGPSFFSSGHHALLAATHFKKRKFVCVDEIKCGAKTVLLVIAKT